MQWTIDPAHSSIEFSVKHLGIATINGSQHSAARKMLAIHGVDSDKDLTFVQVGDESAQLQAMVSNSIQVAALTPPYVFLGRDKFKMNILESSIDKFASKAAVTVKQRRANAKSQADRDRASARARMGMYAHADHSADSAIPARVLSLMTALPFASWPEALDLRIRFGIDGTGDLIFP